MTRLNSKIAALTLLIAIAFGASTVHAGIIINTATETPQCTETEDVKVDSGVIIDSITGIIINTLTGIIINTFKTTDCVRVDSGIIINT